MAGAAPREEGRAGHGELYVGLELGLTKWVLCFSGEGKKYRWVTLEGTEACVSKALEEVGKARKKLGLSAKCRVVSCYEAGRHGFSVHRELAVAGIESIVVDSSSIEVPRRLRRNKTDGLDAKSLVRLLMRWAGGESEALRVVRVPTVEQEDERRLQREIRRLKHERTALTNRIKSLLLLVGVRIDKLGSDFPEVLEKARQFDGTALPPYLLADVQHSYERRCLLDQQLHEIKTVRSARLKQIQKAEQADRKAAQVDQKPESYAEQVASLVLHLTRLSGIGDESAWLLATEFFGWREFRNRRQVAGSAGLVPTVQLSCTVQRDGGISKAGNRRVRWMLQEIAWCWLRFQPNSALTVWYNRKFAGGSSRQRRTGAVALARRLAIDLWRYVADGVVPEGALFKHERPQVRAA